MTHDPTTHELAAELRDLDDDELFILPIPFGLTASGRAQLLTHFGDRVTELRDAGWTLDTGIKHVSGGDVLWIEPT